MEFLMILWKSISEEINPTIALLLIIIFLLTFALVVVLLQKSRERKYLESRINRLEKIIEKDRYRKDRQFEKFYEQLLEKSMPYKKQKEKRK